MRTHFHSENRVWIYPTNACIAKRTPTNVAPICKPIAYHKDLTIIKKKMMLLKTVILLSWAANECTAFVPSILVPRRDLFQPHLSNNNEVSTKNEVKVKHCIPLQEIGLDDLPRVGGKSLIV